MCCIFSDEPISDPRGRYQTRLNAENKFQTSMLEAPCVDFPWSCCWCLGQFIPYTCCITQYCLRYRVLEGDMSKYTCCQGYINCCQGCGCRSGEMGEKDCPEFCLCLESTICNGFAVSASRLYVMDKYNLQSDPCDYRLIRFSNCMQMLACICEIAAIFNDGFRGLAQLVDNIADLIYHAITGCMTAQVAYEVKYQIANRVGGINIDSNKDPTFYPVQSAPPQQVYYAPPPNGQPQPQVVYVQQAPPAPAPGQQVVYMQGSPPPQQVYMQGPPSQQVYYAAPAGQSQPQQQVVYMNQPPPQQVIYVQQAPR